MCFKEVGVRAQLVLGSTVIDIIEVIYVAI
jgi:hypothetical protein